MAIQARVLAIIGLFVGMFVLLMWALKFVPFDETIQWIKDLGWVGNLLIALVYIILCFPVPLGTSPLSLMAGYLYGMLGGYFTLSFAAIVGCALSFICCRQLFRARVEETIKTKPTLKAILKAVDKNGLKICLLMRCAPFFFGLQNAMFAVSTISFETYMIGTILGLLPESLILLYIGSTAKDITDVIAGNVEATPLQKGLIILQLVVCVLILGFLGYQGKKALSEAVKNSETKQPGSNSPSSRILTA